MTTEVCRIDRPPVSRAGPDHEVRCHHALVTA
jgi:hypothetical protein